MRSMRLGLAVVAVGAAVLPVTAGAAGSRPGVTYRVSISSHGLQANGASVIDNGANADRVSLSANGRFVAFESSATNLVPGDTNKLPDVFVHDTVRRTTVRVSVSSSGAQGSESTLGSLPGSPPCSALMPPSPGTGAFSAPVGSPGLSADGQLVAFTSCFTNLVPADTNVASDVFVHNMKTGTTTRVSLTSTGQQTAYSSWGGSLSDNGRIVVFTSQGSLDPAGSSCSQPPLLLGLVPSLCSDGTQVYAHDLRTGRTWLVSATASRLAGNGPSWQASVSPDGRYAVFISRATDLVPGQSAATANPPAEVYVRDLVKGTTALASVGIDGAPSNQDCGDPGDTSSSIEHVMSADDRFVVFGCEGTNLVPNYGPPTHSGNAEDVYIRDLHTGRVERVSVDSTGGTLNQDIQPSLSRNGRYVVYYAGNPPGVLTFPWQAQVLLHDNLTGATEFISIPLDGDLRPKSTAPASLGADVSADGRYVAFASQATNLVHGDTNGFADVFVRDRGTALGVGGLAGAGKLTVTGATTFAVNGVVSVAGAPGGASGVLDDAGTTLTAAMLAYRPASADLFARLDLDRMPTLAAASPAVVYGLDLTVDGRRYEVRAAKTGAGASLGLFTLRLGVWTQVATLAGGYGTTGQEVVFALPLRDLGAADGGHISDVRAFTGLGTYLTGAAHVVDVVRLAPKQ